MGKYIFFFFLLIGLTLGEEEPVPVNKRKGKLLLVTTTTSTTTLSTMSPCYIATAVLGALGCGRKKRDVFGMEEDIAETSDVIDPSRAVAEAEMDLEDSKLEARDPKFLNYFLTVTRTFTFTSFTATSTLASLYCTPPAWTMGACVGAAGRR